MFGKYFYYIFLILLISCYSKKIQDINSICKKVTNKHHSVYKTVKELLKNINYNLKDDKREKISEKSYHFLLGTNFEKSDELNIFFIIKNYLINLYMLPILLIWIIFFILFFRKQFIFNSTFSLEIIPKFYRSIIIIIIFFFIFLLSITTLSKLNDLNSSINEAFCFLLKFFYELNHGKIKEAEIINNITIKYNNINSNDIHLWPGLYELNSILLDSCDAINKIAINENKTFIFLEEIINNSKEYKDLMKSLIDTASKKIPNPNCFLDFDILTRYSYEFNDISRDNSFINIINNEYMRYFNNATELIKSLNNYCSIMTKKNDLYDLELNNFYENISDFSSLMKETYSNITNNILVFHEHFEIISLIIKVFEIFSILFDVFIIILILLPLTKNIILMQLIINICWNLSFLLIIFNISFWYFFYNLEEINDNIIYILEKDIFNTESNIFFNTCLNTEESDLIQVLNLFDKKSVLIDIDRYYKNILPIYDSLIAIEQEIPNLQNMKIISKNFDNYLNNYEISTNSTYQSSDISYVLKEITKLTNNVDKIPSDILCESEDIWVTSKRKCKNYKYISIYDVEKKFERNKNEKYCFLIQDIYEESDLENIYKDICPNNTYNKIVKYIIGLTNYYNHNENMMSSLEKIFKELERKNKKLSTIIISQIKNCLNDISDLIDIYNPILGKNNITNLFKCGGLKRKVVNFYDINYNKIVYYCRYNKTYTAIIIILQILGNVFIIINNKEKKEKKETKRKYLNFQNKDVNNDGVELIEEVSGEDDDISII